MIPSNTPPGTPVGGGLNPNAGPPGDDSHAEAPPQVLTDGGGSHGSCTRAEAVGNPIFAGTGNKFQEEVDFTPPSGLRFARYYNSSLPGWTHSYSMRVLTRENRAVAIRPTGRAHAFTGAGPGEWAGDPQVRDQLIRLDAVGPGGSTWKYLVADGSTEYYDAEGRIMRIVHRGGQAFTAQHEQGFLRSVTDPFGRSLQFDYDDQGRLRTARMPGMDAAYYYDDLGRLSRAIANGAVRSYLYENSAYPLALTAIHENWRPHASWTYDSQGRAVLSEHAGGAQRHHLEYAADGSVRVVDPLSTARVQRYGAAGAKQVFSGQNQPCANCIGDAAERTFDATSGLVLQSRDYLGVNTSFAYDSRKLLSSVTRAQGRPEQRQLQIEWHPTLRLPVRVIEPGRTTEYAYDGFGNTLGKTLTDAATGEHRTWRWTYNSLGLAESMTDPRGGVWIYGHDAQGNRISVVDPTGEESRFTFDGAGYVLTESRPGRALRSYARDARHRVMFDTMGDETTVYDYYFSNSYSEAAEPDSMQRPDGYGVNYTLDAARRLTGITDSRGINVQFTLDGAGNRVREEIRDEAGQLAKVTTRVINELGRVASFHGARGQTTSLAYDANGGTVSITDPLNQTTRRSLDGLRRLTATTFPDNTSAMQAWSPLDQMKDVTDPKGVATQYRHNAFGEIVSETSPDIGTVVYRRDALGDVVGIEDAKSQVTTIDRDRMGRPREIRRADGETAFLQYNGAGDLVRMDDGSGSTRFGHDDHGRVVSKGQTVNDNASHPSQHGVVYRYRQGRLLAVYYPSGLKIYYRRDQGRVVGIDAQLPGGVPSIKFITDLTYTALSQPKSWRWSNGEQASRYFDMDGRVTATEFAEYIHDAAGRITGIDQKLWVRNTEGGSEVFTPTSLSWTVGYDSRDRVIRFQRPGASAEYNHDPNGNRLTATDSVTSDLDLEGEFEQGGLTRTTRQVLNVDTVSNRMLGLMQSTEITQQGKPVSAASTTVTYTLDENGSLTSDGLHEFDYDAANRLSRMRAAKTGEPMTVRYLHNAAGQRVFRSEPAAEFADPSAETLGEGFIAWLKQRFGSLFAAQQAESALGTVYVYADGELPSWALLGEYDNGSALGKGRTEYIWLPLEDGSAIPIGFLRNRRLYAVHSDHLGTPRLVTDDERRPVWQWPYSAFGNNKPTGPLVQRAANGSPHLTRTEPIEFGLRFPGQHEDAEAGLANNLFRWYHAGIGRYTQFDPIGLRGGWNGFIYADNSPLTKMDPSGLNPMEGIIDRSRETRDRETRPPPRANVPEPTPARSNPPGPVEVCTQQCMAREAPLCAVGMFTVCSPCASLTPVPGLICGAVCGCAGGYLCAQTAANCAARCNATGGKLPSLF